MIGLIKDKQSEGNGAVRMCQQVRQHKATCKQHNRSIHDWTGKGRLVSQNGITEVAFKEGPLNI